MSCYKLLMLSLVKRCWSSFVCWTAFTEGAEQLNRTDLNNNRAKCWRKHKLGSFWEAECIQSTKYIKVNLSISQVIPYSHLKLKKCVQLLKENFQNTQMHVCYHPKA